MKRVKWLTGILFVAAVLVFGYGALQFAHRIYYTHAYPMQYLEYVQKASEKTGVPPSLIYAVIRPESGFDPNVESSVGARGLMQITEETMEWAMYRSGSSEDEVSYDSLFDPQTNITYGTYILSLLLDEFSQIETALCAYHAGWGNVKQWLSQEEYSKDGFSVHNIPFGDTRQYVEKVTETMKLYQELYDIS